MVMSPTWEQAWAVEDDWRGTTDRNERKRKQNRLNQRTYRKNRKALKLGENGKSQNGAGTLQVMDGASLLTCPRRSAQVRQAINSAYESYVLKNRGLTNLHVLIRLNVLDALSRNAALMGFWTEGLCKDDYVSPYNDHGPRLPHTDLTMINCSQSLAPTHLQRVLVHHPWIDLFPFPGFRDQVLLAVDAGRLDEDELCMDILEVGGREIEERPALLVWGDSSDPYAWEASPAFLQRWGWLVKNCPELQQSTNTWRERRREPKLLFGDAPATRDGSG